MSRHQARTALDQLIGRPALVSPVHAGQSIGLEGEVTSGSMLADLRALADASKGEESEHYAERCAALASTYGFDAVASDKSFIFSNGYALIPIHGLLINRFSWSWGFVTGYNFIRNQLAAARADTDVTAIIFDINSYGGTVAGCQETADLIYEARSDKPIIAVIDANCCSAAYYLASQATHIACTPTGSVGSIGVVMMHCDISRMLDEAGVTITFLVAGSHKVDGNMFEPLSAEVAAEFQAEIDFMYDTFVEYVVQGRGLNEADVRATEARCYGSGDALDLGLIDAVQNPIDAVEDYFISCEEAEDVDDDDEPEEPGDDEDDDPPDEQESVVRTRPAVTGTNTPAPVAAAEPEVTSVDVNAVSAEARTAERQRIAGIQNHAEAAGREQLASHLALNTDMDVATAAGILAASPKSTPPAPVPAAVEEVNHFQAAMNSGQHPEVGASTEGGEGDDNLSPAQRILAIQAKHFGVTSRH